MTKNGKTSGPVILRTHRTQGTQPSEGPKLSEIIKQMAIRLMKNPSAIPSEPAAVAALMLAGAAWNSALGDNVMRDQHRKLVEQIDWDGAIPWAELRSDDTDQLVAELADYKRAQHPADLRRIVATELSPEGKVRVHWTAPERVVKAAFSPVGNKPGSLKAKRGRPIADKLIKKMHQYIRGKVVDLNAVIAGRKNAEELQKTVATREDLAGFHPAHAAYVYAQNQVSAMSEQLTALTEMDRFVKLIAKAEDEYMPSGPPMSPLTTSFFTCWAFFDACAGIADETIGTTTLAVGSAFGMQDELLRVIGLLQESRMGVYAHEGVEKDVVVLRELVTDRVCRAISPSGYRGRKGELWYARVLPPPLPGLAEHVIFTTPYVLQTPGEYDWQAYFRRALPNAPPRARLDAYERHMKFGPSRAFWSEFVFEAYVNYQSDVIFLAGLPDMPKSRPHSSVNS
jgi:hypothetical protein